MTRRTFAITIAVVAVVLAGGLWVLASDTALQWAVREMQTRSSGRLALEHVSGSLLSRLHADRVAWQGETNATLAEDMHVSWSPLWLLAGVAAFDNVNVRTLTVTSTAPSHNPARLPEDLKLPLRVRFADAGVDTLTLVNPAGDERTFRGVAMTFAAGPDRWSAKLAGMQTTWGTVRASADLATASPFALKAAATLEPEGRATDVPPMTMKADVSGNLSAFDLQIAAKAQTSAADATLRIEPFASQPVSAIDAALHAFDVRHLLPNAPQAILDGTLKATKDRDGMLRGPLEITNRAAGTIDTHRVPLAKLSSELVAAPERWWLEGLVADLGAGGKVTGTGWVSADETGFVLVTDGVDLHGIHPQLRTTHLAGNVYTSGPFDRQQMRVALADRQVAFAGDAVFEPNQLTVRRASARAGGGRFEASGMLALDPQRAFTLKTSFAGLDPSQFGRYDKASLSGHLAASGELAPVLHVRADGMLAPSTLYGLPASAEVRWASKGVDDPTIGLNLKAKLGQTHVTARGSIRDPARLQAVDLAIDLGGNDLQDLYTITHLPFPSTPAYRINGRLAFKDKVWSLRGFRGEVGQSDLSGDFIVDQTGDRPLMRAELTSQRLDMRDLGGFIGIDYHAPDPAPDKLLPHHPYKLGKLNAANADIRFTGRSFRNERLPLHRMTARLRLDNGRVRLDPLNFRAAGGAIDARIAMDARRAPIRTAADIQVRGLQLNQLAPGVKAVLASAGTIDGRTELAMTGNSFAEMLGSADGNLMLAMNGGSMSDLVLRLANLDVAHALVVLARGDRNIPLRCVVADFAAENGVLRPRTLVLDSEHTVVRGEGAVNLGTEELAIRLVAEPKDGSVFALRGPIRVDGTLKHPALHPELGNMLARGGAAVALASVATPIAAIIPFLQMGKPQKVDCEPLILDASRFIRAANTPATDKVAAAPQEK